MKKTILVTIIVSICLVFIGTICVMARTNAPKLTDQQRAEQIESLQKFEQVRDSLYDCSLTICTRLMQDEECCFYEVVDEGTIEVLKTYRVPSLNILLQALAQIDEDGNLADIYDDDEGTLFKYDRLREEYNSFFSK